MSDITKCSGLGCTNKDTCYRYLATDGFRQSWFIKPPVDNKGMCEHYWEEIDRGYKEEQDTINTLVSSTPSGYVGYLHTKNGTFIAFINKEDTRDNIYNISLPVLVTCVV